MLKVNYIALYYITCAGGGRVPQRYHLYHSILGSMIDGVGYVYVVS